MVYVQQRAAAVSRVALGQPCRRPRAGMIHVVDPSLLDRLFSTRNTMEEPIRLARLWSPPPRGRAVAAARQRRRP